MELSLHRLRLLREFARRGTVTRAAEVLQYTPSAVSQQLSALEREVEVVIFEHVGRRLRLTPDGRLLALHAVEILAAEERARTALEQAQKTLTAELTVGVVATVAASLLPPTLRILGEQEPGVTVRTREVSPEVALAAVRDGEFDMTFVLDYPETPVSLDVGLRSTVITVEQHYLVAAEDRCDAASPVELADFADHDWIASGQNTDYGRAFLATCRRAGFEPRIRHQIDDQSTAMIMAAGGLGVSLIADLGLKPHPENVRILRAQNPPLRRLLLVRRKSTGHRSSEEAFVRSALEAARLTGIHPDMGSRAPPGAEVP